MKEELVEPVTDLIQSAGLPTQDQLELAKFFARVEDDLLEWFVHYGKLEPSWITALSQNLRAKKALVQFTSHMTPQDLWKKEQAFFSAQEQLPPAAPAGAGASLAV